MKDLIDELPGISMPVGEVPRRLDKMWQADAGTEGSPSEFRASQMNVVLHFGLKVSGDEARERFNTLIKFAQRYPSRIIVLCPCESIESGAMRAKLFSQCYIGDSHREMCCCEALMLGYQPDSCGFLANQVTVWLESDLPTYHWFNRVPTGRIEAYFDNLLVGVRRCIYDSSVEGDEIGSLDWPKSLRVGDLAKARILPIRQAIGQYLSGYDIEQLCHGIKSVRICHADSMSGEGRRLMEWIKDCFAECDKCEDCDALKADYELDSCEDTDESLVLELDYNDGRYFKWKMSGVDNFARVEAYLGKSKENLTTRVKPMGPEQTISEALFF